MLMSDPSSAPKPAERPEAPEPERPQFKKFFKRAYILSSLWLLAASCLMLSVPWYIVQIIDRGIVQQDMHALALYLVLAAASQACAGICRYIGNNRIMHHALSLSRERQKTLYQKVMSADLMSFPQIAQGKALGQLLTAARSEQSFFEILYRQCMPLIVSAVITLGALFMLSWKLACLSIMLLPLAGFLWLYLKKRIRSETRASYESWENVYRVLADSFRTLIPIRALHLTDHFSRKFDDVSGQCLDTGYRLQKTVGVQAPAFDIIQALILVALFGFGGMQVMHGELSIGILLGFQVYLSRLFSLVRNGTGIFGAYQSLMEGQSRARALEALPPAPHLELQAACAPELLRIDGLCFAFGTRNIWHDFNFSLAEGEYRAILLPSGSGKTTLARCILGLYPHPKGTICIPDGDSRTIGFVPQDNTLFNGSIRDNIAFAHEQPITDEAFTRVFKACCLENVCAHFGDEPIGEYGAKLSGGEQRRVMLARALANNPKLLIIDQLASELEPDLCRQIFRNIRQMAPKLGILYLGHRAPEWD